MGQHLRAFVQLRRQGDTLSIWRTRAGLEVDFVVYGSEFVLGHRGEVQCPY